MTSIQRRLLVWLIGAVLLTGLLVSAVTYQLAWDAFNRVRDYGLEQIAHSVVRHGVHLADNEHRREDGGQFISQIWSTERELLYSSIDDDGPPPQPDGFNVVQWNDATWRTYTLTEHGLTIQVASSVARRARTFAEIVPWLLIPLAALILGLSVFIGAAVKRVLAPLDRVRREVEQRGATHLRAIDDAGLPDEVAPLVRTLNELLRRLDEAMATQRQFLSDAAHELRTPLAVIKLQAQLAARADDARERATALAQLEQGVARGTHLVAQLLSMARLEPSAGQLGFERVALDEVATNVVAELSSLAEARGIDLGLSRCDAVAVDGDAASLRMLLGNLIDNALRYCPTGSRVDVAVTAHSSGALLSVIDDGPGIPDEERDSVFQRFHRLAGSEVPGSGLGLAIVRRIATLHGGDVELHGRRPHGLSARVHLPARLHPSSDSGATGRHD